MADNDAVNKITLESEVGAVDNLFPNSCNVLKEKKVNGRGRPKSKPDSKLASFNLPLDLIGKIDKESALVSAGNKSLFIIGLLENYFYNKDKNRSAAG